MSNCVICNAPIELTSKTGPLSIYCSAKCRRSRYELQYNERRRERRNAALAARPLHRYLSLGGGVNSIALMLWLLDNGIEHEAVYADVGCDWPETREYVEMLKTKGYPVTILETRRAGKSLIEWCLHYEVVPNRFMRWCTVEWKVRPLSRYFQKPAVVYIGIDAGEVWRSKHPGTKDINYEYPLVEADIDRAGCAQIITAHGLPIPRKSNCYICPFQTRKQFLELQDEHPDLYCGARHVEELTNARLNRLGMAPTYLLGRKPLGLAVGDQMDMFDERQVRPCLCEFE